MKPTYRYGTLTIVGRGTGRPASARTFTRLRVPNAYTTTYGSYAAASTAASAVAATVAASYANGITFLTVVPNAGTPNGPVLTPRYAANLGHYGTLLIGTVPGIPGDVAVIAVTPNVTALRPGNGGLVRASYRLGARAGLPVGYVTVTLTGAA